MFKNNHPDFFHTQNGIRIFFNTNFSLKGKKNDHPLLVFNYGFLCSNAHFKYQIPFFEKKGIQILIHDYRCHFSSSGMEDIESCTFDNINSDLTELILFIGLKNNIMIGHSMGVNITLEFARRNPNLIQKMVLISGTILPPQDVMFSSGVMGSLIPYIKKFKNNYPYLHQAGWKKAFMVPLLRKIIYYGGFNTKKVPEEFIHLYMKRIGELHPDLFLKLMEEMRTHDIINHLQDIHTPALIIGGDKDMIIPDYLQRILQKNLKNTETYIVKEGSHVPQVDFPESINQRILFFIQKKRSKKINPS